jgi:hypothetical protein
MVLLIHAEIRHWFILRQVLIIMTIICVQCSPLQFDSSIDIICEGLLNFIFNVLSWLFKSSYAHMPCA